MASLGKLPAEVAPVGVDRDGLPIGLQVIARYLGDLTAVHLRVSSHVKYRRRDLPLDIGVP